MILIVKKKVLKFLVTALKSDFFCLGLIVLVEIIPQI